MNRLIKDLCLSCLLWSSTLFNSNRTIHHISLSVHPDEDDEKSQIPTEFALSQNDPDSFDSTASISFPLLEKSEVIYLINTLIGKSLGTRVSRERWKPFITALYGQYGRFTKVCCQQYLQILF